MIQIVIRIVKATRKQFGLGVGVTPPSQNQGEHRTASSRSCSFAHRRVDIYAFFQRGREVSQAETLGRRRRKGGCPQPRTSTKTDRFEKEIFLSKEEHTEFLHDEEGTNACSSGVTANSDTHDKQASFGRAKCRQEAKMILMSFKDGIDIFGGRFGRHASEMNVGRGVESGVFKCAS